jgi:hypothetical protein
MTVLERCTCVQDDVDLFAEPLAIPALLLGGFLCDGAYLDVQLVASVVRLEALDLLDSFCEAHCQVQHFWRLAHCG